MSGFDFRYRRGGGPPTVRMVAFKNTETLTRGDLLTFGGNAVALAMAGDLDILGAAQETLDGNAGTTYIRVITDADAVYAVDDPFARVKGDPLSLIGLTGAQGVAVQAASELVVELDSTQTEETLVAIDGASHHDLGPARPAIGLGPTGAELNAALARVMTRSYRRHTGRGPTKTQAFYRGDVIVVVLEDTMTKAERTLAARGRHDAVRAMRDAFQETMQGEVVMTVEELTGSKVRAFMSASQIDPDITITTFVLDRPIGGDPDIT